MECLLVGRLRSNPSLDAELKKAGVEALWLDGDSFPSETLLTWSGDAIRIGGRPAGHWPCFVCDYAPPYPHPQRRYAAGEWKGIRTDFPHLIINESEAGSVVRSVMEAAQARGDCRPTLPALNLCGHPEALALALHREGIPATGPSAPLCGRVMLAADGTAERLDPAGGEATGPTVGPDLLWDTARAARAFLGLQFALIDIGASGAVVRVNPTPPWESLGRPWREKMIKWMLATLESRP
jgi:hypothetical protein